MKASKFQTPECVSAKQASMDAGYRHLAKRDLILPISHRP
jgi:hypothetical protein